MTLPIPYGLSLVPSQVPTPPDRREYVDSNNQIQSGRFIDTTTKDYVLNANGQFVGQDIIKQQVYMSLITIFGSSAQNTLGNTLFQIKLITPNIVSQCQNACQQALANLINNGSVLLNGVNVILNGPGNVIVQVFWTELSTDTQQTTNLPLTSQ